MKCTFPRELVEWREMMDTVRKTALSKAAHKRTWFRAMVYVLLAYLGCCAFLYFYQDSLLFPAHLAAPPTSRPDGAETISLPEKGGGAVESWFFPAGARGRERAAPVVIYFHGNAELIDHQERVIEGYRRLGISVFLPEYPGYGRSSGKPSQKAIGAAAVRLYDALILRADVDVSRIVFHGRSLGGGVAADLATRRRPAALVLESTFSSITRMGLKYGAPPFLARHPFRTDRAIAGLDAPILVFHGTQDKLVPVAHGRRLRDLARHGAYVEYDADHNDFPGAANEGAYWAEIEAFLRRCGILRPRPPG